MDSGEGTKRKKQIGGKRKAIALEQESPSADDLSAENMMAGFDNPGKLLYTTVRVLVENALDSVESITQLPLVEVTIEEIYKSSLKLMTSSLATGHSSQKKVFGKKVKAAKEFVYRVTCKDNGRGMTGDDIPTMFGQVLSGTKGGAKQTRGESGLSAKMAFVWAKESTGVPIEISTSMKNQDYTTFCGMEMDIISHAPHILLLEKRSSREKWHGAEFKVVVEGEWTAYGSKILEYMRRIAVITPYAEFKYRFVAATPDKKDVEIVFPRRTNVMPPKTKCLPSAVNLNMIKRLIAQTPNQRTLWRFLEDEFVNIESRHVSELIEKMGPGVTMKTKVKSLTCQQLGCMLEFFQHAKFDDHLGENCLSPVGADSLRLGVMKQLRSENVAAHSASVHYHEGHPFIVEAGVSLGGRDIKEGITVFRFANRVPLLFAEEADVVTTSMNRIDWRRYKINKERHQVGVFVSIVSAKISFKWTGDDHGQIASAVQACLENCCLQLEAQLHASLDDKATDEFYTLDAMRKIKYKVEDEKTAKLIKDISAGKLTLESMKNDYRRREEKLWGLA